MRGPIRELGTEWNGWKACLDPILFAHQTPRFGLEQRCQSLTQGWIQRRIHVGGAVDPCVLAHPLSSGVNKVLAPAQRRDLQERTPAWAAFRRRHPIHTNQRDAVERHGREVREEGGPIPPTPSHASQQPGNRTLCSVVATESPAAYTPLEVGEPPDTNLSDLEPGGGGASADHTRIVERLRRPDGSQYTAKDVHGKQE